MDASSSNGAGTPNVSRSLSPIFSADWGSHSDEHGAVDDQLADLDTQSTPPPHTYRVSSPPSSYRATDLVSAHGVDSLTVTAASCYAETLKQGDCCSNANEVGGDDGFMLQQETEVCKEADHKGTGADIHSVRRKSNVHFESEPAAPQAPDTNRRESRMSIRLSRLSRNIRPLSFADSIWVKTPEDLVLAFSFDDEEAAHKPDSRPHHTFSRARKKRLVYLVSLAAMFSPLSSNIYFPALDTIAKVLHTRIELIALTVTIYMLFQGLAPSFWGPLADVYGRRPILFSTLLVYLLANLGLALSRNFATLMVFRGVQAIGSSATIAIGAGVIGDFALAGERGGFMGLFGGIRMFGQAIGPTLGGALAQYLGFRSIFWFLLCFAGLVVVLLILFLPETLRAIAGDGSRPLHGVYRPLLGRNPTQLTEQQNDRYVPPKPSFRTLVDSFALLAEKDVFVTLLFGGIIYAVWSMITSSTSSLFREEMNLSDVQIGLIFLPNGIGCVLGSLVTGKVMDRDYKREAVRFRESNDLPADTELKSTTYPSFPIERARLRSVVVLSFLFAVATGVYGFSVEWHIAVPLLLQFITAFTATAIFNINSTLMIDLYPTKPASATAINNLVRCTLGAIGVGVIERMIGAYEEAIAFLALAILSWAMVALVFVERKYGPRWRIARLERLSN